MVIPALLPARANFTATGSPRKKAATPSGSIGLSTFDHETATVTVKLPCVGLPLASVPVHATAVAPSAKSDPEDGAHESCGAGSTVSVTAAA